MRASIFILLTVLVVSLVVTTTGCSKKGEGGDSIINTSQTGDITSAPVDTNEISVTDSLVKATPMPKRADELFDDFFFNFYINDKLQNARIQFPLKVSNAEQTVEMQRDDWKMDHFFRYEEFYSVMAPSQKALRCAGDTTVKHVTVENMQFGHGNVKQYIFNRVDGKWMMQQINTVSLKSHPDADFLDFLYKFTTDQHYQHESLASTISYVGPTDEDDAGSTARTIDKAEWDDVLHVLPDNYEHNVNATGIYNIVYGDRQSSSNQRVVSFRGIANGEEVRYSFKKEGDSWKLVKYEM